MKPSLQQFTEKRACKILAEISNQETVYKWTVSSETEHPSFSKRKITSENTPKSIRLPLLLNKKIMDYQNRQQPIKGKKFGKKNMNSVRGFFNQNTHHSNPHLYKLENSSEDPLEQQILERKRADEVEIVKSWLKHKRLQCKSLNNIINKFKDDSNKLKTSIQKLPFTIKSYEDNI